MPDAQDTAGAFPLTELPLIPARFHFIGIGGISMSGLARILHEWGYQVSGSDRIVSPNTELLATLGIRIQIGHDSADLASDADILVVTPRAINGAPLEIAAALGNGATMVRRGQLLGMIANARQTIGVAGSHGKSTTSGMLATALSTTGHDPSYSVGAVVASTGRTADSGSGPLMVVEADEFDRAMLWLEPTIAIVTSISFDHPDCFEDQLDYDQAFVDYAQRIRPDGVLITSAEDEGCRRLVSTLGTDRGWSTRIVTFAEQTGGDWTYRRAGNGWWIDAPDGEHVELALQVPGRHNAANATAAIIAMVEVGIPLLDAVQGLEAFSGVNRRFEHKGRAGDVDVVDDYGHHPDEIRATIAAARDRYPERRMVVAFQPHTYSRTALLLDGFATAMDLADVPVLLDVFPAGEENLWNVTSSTVSDRMRKSAKVLAGIDDAVAFLADVTQPEDVVLTLGAGDITVVAERLVDRLRSRSEESSPKGSQTSTRTSRPIRSTTRARSKTIPLPGTEANIQLDFDMSLQTTMRLGGSADYLVRAATPEIVETAVSWASDQQIPVTVIGGGSNLLVGDAGIRGLVMVVRTPGQRAESLIASEDLGDAVRVTVGAQAPISWVGRYCAEHGWSGMDWAVGLPGQVGGATVNNAGAHGTEIKDHLHAVEVLEEGGILTYGREWLDPSYRLTRIKAADRPRPWTILRSVFMLPKGDPAKLVKLANEHADFRKSTQPSGACSGSTFANPPGDYAGRLLEASGMKGHSIGGMQFSPKHANWVMNTGEGTAREAWALIQHARGVVQDRFGVDLRPEIERVGDHG